MSQRPLRRTMAPFWGTASMSREEVEELIDADANSDRGRDTWRTQSACSAPPNSSPAKGFVFLVHRHNTVPDPDALHNPCPQHNSCWVTPWWHTRPLIGWSRRPDRQPSAGSRQRPPLRYTSPSECTHAVNERAIMSAAHSSWCRP